MTVLPKCKKGQPKERPVQPGPSRNNAADQRAPSPGSRKSKRLIDLTSTSPPPLKKGYRSRSTSPGFNSDDEANSGVKDEQLELEFVEILRTTHGWQIKQMQGDGACLFRAVADQVYGDEEMHSEVRRLCMDYMDQNRDHFSQFITEDYDAYIARKRLPETHGNHAEIQAISEMYGRPVEIYEYNDQPNNTFNPRPTADQNPPLRLSYHGAVHYNSIVDPHNATVGVGLGLPGFAPGSADNQLLTDTMHQSEMCHIEETMLQDKLHMSDWQKTEEEIQQQVSRESYLQYIQDIEGKKPSSSSKPQDIPSGSKNGPADTDKPCSSKQKANETPGLYEELLLMGAVDWENEDDSAIVAQALLISQQQFMKDLEKKGSDGSGPSQNQE